MLGNFVDDTNFIGALTFAQLGQVDVQDNLSIFIQEHEPKMMQEALGYQLWEDLIAGLDADTPDQKWLDLIQGKEFVPLSTGMWPPFYWNYPFLDVYRNWYIPQNPVRKMQWIGFANDNKARYPSPIACYVFYEYMRDQFTNLSAFGTVAGKSENAGPMLPNQKMSDAFNKMSRNIFFLWQFLEFSGTDVYASYDRLKINYNFFKPINPLGW